MSRFQALIYDRFMRQSEEACLRAWRAELLSPLTGDVLEIGAGTGVNLEHYGTNVTRLVMTEPDRHMRRRLVDRVEVGGGGVEVLGAPAHTLPFPDGSFDALVSTLVLCSVADPAAVLAEIRRVLRPGGRLVFIEHVAAEEGSSRQRWQRRLEPVWKLLADGCHVTRRTDLAIARAGLDIETLERESVRKALPIVRPSIRGVARRA